MNYLSPCCLGTVEYDEWTSMWICNICKEGFNEDELVNEDDDDDRDITDNEVAEIIERGER